MVRSDMYILATLPNPALSVPLFAKAIFSDNKEKDRFADKMDALKDKLNYDVILTTAAIRMTPGMSGADLIKLLQDIADGK
jgi:ATP-dependent Zn protease